MLILTITDAQGHRELTVPDGPYTIGRSADNSLSVPDAQVSRRHAEITQTLPEGTWRIRDCESRFGTFVNEARITQADLNVGDRVRIGQTELRVESSAAPSAATSTSTAVSYDFRQVNALLAGLRALGSGKVLDEVLAIVLDSALEITGADRGFILLADSTGKLALRLARARGGITLTTAKTSQRIPDEVFATGEDRIVTDLLDDAHAMQHAGTVALGIRHVMCTPLKVTQYASEGGERRLGVLYLDSRERGYLQAAGALHALAAEAAVVIENARLYQEVVEKERAAQELRVAAQIQQALLPPGYHLEPFVELAATSTPCRSVGGDLFDYAQRAWGLSFAVADVAGKGTSAAILNAVVQGLFAAEAETADNPAEVLTRVNRALCRRQVASRFVTAFYGDLSPEGTLRYCNAGHNAPFLVTSDGAKRLETGGTVLGLFDASTFESGEVRVSPGDALVVFSDGVTEAVNPADDEFGDDRLEACLSEARTQTAPQVVDVIQKALVEFCSTAPARDDSTILVLKVK